MKNLFSLLVLSGLLVMFGCSANSTANNSSNGTKTDAAKTDKKDEKKAETGPDGKTDLTMEKFMKMELDMSYQQVKDIMTVEGKELTKDRSYSWHGENSASVNANFKDGKLESKFQGQLGPTKGTNEISMDTVDKIKTGMSYEAVKKLLGFEGELESANKEDSSTNLKYRWRNADFGSVAVDFLDNKVAQKNVVNIK
ncbi:MAG: hypothetical protein WBO10_12360 [Pyrinomonadaceae bacterium]